MDTPGPSSMLIVFVILLFLSAFFSAAETALISVNKIRLRTKAEDGDKHAERVLRLSNDFDRTLSAILIGNNVVNIASASISTLLFSQMLGAQGVALATLVTTILVLIFGEVLPKSFAKENAEKIAIISSGPLEFIKVVLSPFIWFFIAIKRVLTGKRSADLNVAPSVTEEELKTIIDTVEEEGVLERQETDIIQSAIDFNTITVQEILIPRVDISAVEINTQGQEIVSVCLESGYSRVPVYEGNIDNIIGIIHAKDLLSALANNETITARNLLREVKFVYRTKHINDLLAELRREKQHIAIVTDEHGGTMGLVTMEDILEELVGEIWDESDHATTSICQVGENTWQVSGDTNPEDLFEEIGFEEKRFDSECTSVSGWALEILEHIPQEGETFHYKELDARILKVHDKRIQLVEIVFQKPEPGTTVHV